MEGSWESVGPPDTGDVTARRDGLSARWERLTPTVARRRMPGWDATVGVVAGTEGVLLIDTGACPRDGLDIRRQAGELYDRPVRWVALTHPHFDHVLGTAAFPEARVYGADGMAEALTHGPVDLLEDAVRNGMDREGATAAVRALSPPRHPVSQPLTLRLGGGHRAVLVPVGPGHSGHDLVVWVPGAHGDPDVLFCGDLVEESGEPQAGPDAAPQRWPAALDRLLSLGGDRARYVPGHGAVVDAAFVRAQRDTLIRRFGIAP